MCLTIRTLIPIPHFTLFKGKSVYKCLYKKYLYNGKVEYYTPAVHTVVPDNGILIPEKNSKRIWWFNKWFNEWTIEAGYIHCYDRNVQIYWHNEGDIYEATIPPFTLYFKGRKKEIACKKLIIHLPKNN